MGPEPSLKNSRVDQFLARMAYENEGPGFILGSNPNGQTPAQDLDFVPPVNF